MLYLGRTRQRGLPRERVIAGPGEDECPSKSGSVWSGSPSSTADNGGIQ